MCSIEVLVPGQYRKRYVLTVQDLKSGNLHIEPRIDKKRKDLKRSDIWTQKESQHKCQVSTNRTEIASIHGSLQLVWTMGSKSERPWQTEACSRVFTPCNTLYISSFDFANLPLPAPIQPWIVEGSGTRTGTSWIPALPLFWLGNDIVRLATLKHQMPKITSGSVCQYTCWYIIYRTKPLLDLCGLHSKEENHVVSWT